MIDDWRLRLLSDREAQVLEVHCQGRTTREVSEDLGITLATVRTHHKNIYGKLGVSSLISAVADRLNHRIETGV